MVSKKEAVMLAALAVGSIGLAAAVHGGGDAAGGGVLGQPMGAMPVRTGGILGSQEGYGYTPKIDQAPAQAAVIFPGAPDYREVFDRFFVKPEIPVSRGAAGVSAAPKGRPFSTKKESLTEPEAKSMGWEEGMDRPFGGFATSTPITPKKTQFDRLPAGCDASSSSSKGMSGTALPGRPYISKKPM